MTGWTALLNGEAALAARRELEALAALIALHLRSARTTELLKFRDAKQGVTEPRLFSRKNREQERCLFSKHVGISIRELEKEENKQFSVFYKIHSRDS